MAFDASPGGITGVGVCATVGRFYPLRCGGGERHLYLLARTLVAKGVDLAIVMPWQDDRWPRFELLDGGVPLYRHYCWGLRVKDGHRQRGLGRVGTPIYIAGLLRQLWDLRDRWTVVHAHQGTEHAFVSVLAAKLWGRRSVVTLWNSRQYADRLVLLRRRSRLLGPLMWRVILQADRFVAASSDIAEELESLEILTDWVHVEQSTRVCTTILEVDGTTTELVGNTGSISDTALDEFIEKFRIHSQVADVSVLTGSIPANAGNEYYANLIRHLPGRFILDIRGEGLIQTLPYCPFLVKPNREELEQTVGSKLNTSEEILDAMQTLNGWGAQWVVVSNGPENLLLTSREEAWSFTPPKVQVVNPIGCGDCLAAGIAVAVSEGKSIPEAVIIGISAAVGAATGSNGLAGR